MTNINFPLNFGSIRKLLGLKQLAVADAAGLNHHRLCWLEVGYRDPTKGEDKTLRAVLVKVAIRRRQEIETAIVWLQSSQPQTWESDPRKALFEIEPLPEGREASSSP
jgi:hypothetical protein